MALLHIALQEGFSNDSVRILTNDREVYSKTGVKTRNQIGFADSWEADIPPATVDILISVPSRNASERMALPVLEATYLGVSVTREGKVVYRVSPEPFRYM
jgi:hypothetical protein